MQILESSTGDQLGNIDIRSMNDENILAWLCSRGYLDGVSDEYEISLSYPFAEGEITVVCIETKEPVLTIVIDNTEILEKTL
jgi:hypothetical protein